MHTSRREFLKHSALATGAATVGLDIARQAHATAVDDTLKVALVGCGGRGAGAAKQALDVSPRTTLVAVADVFRSQAENALANVKKAKGDQVAVPDDHVFAGLDAYQKACATDCDMVVIATPPGFRPLHYAAAIEAGKHVFMEKPLCTDAAGYRSLLETNRIAEEQNLKVGVGLQRHHEDRYRETIEKIHDGAIGDVNFLRVYWNMGNIWAKARQEGDTEAMYQLRNWQYFYYLGGDNIVEQHIHNIDVANWVMKGHPVEANGMGGRARRDEFPNMGQIYDHHFVEFTYGDGTKMFSQARQMPDCWRQVAEFVHGSKGIADCSGKIEGENAWRFRGKHRGGHAQEHFPLQAAIREDTPFHEGWYGADSSFTAVFGRMANYSGKLLKWEDAIKAPALFDPAKLTIDGPMPIMPDADGTYASSVATPGVYDPFNPDIIDNKIV